MLNYEQLKKNTKEQLSLARWSHTKRVVETAEKLAFCHQVAIEDAKVAALLHDYCKEWPSNKLTFELKRVLETQLLIQLKHWLKFEAAQNYPPTFWHGPVAALVAKEFFNIKNQDILNSIAYHTTGRPNMSNLEKVVLLADYLEPNRNFPGVLRLRQLAQSDLSQAMLHVTETKISYLLENSKVIFPGTLVTRNYYLLESEQSNEDN